MPSSPLSHPSALCQAPARLEHLCPGEFAFLRQSQRQTRALLCKGGVEAISQGVGEQRCCVRVDPWHVWQGWPRDGKGPALGEPPVLLLRDRDASPLCNMGTEVNRSRSEALAAGEMGAIGRNRETGGKGMGGAQGVVFSWIRDLILPQPKWDKGRAGARGRLEGATVRTQGRLAQRLLPPPGALRLHWFCTGLTGWSPWCTTTTPGQSCLLRMGFVCLDASSSPALCSGL